MKNKKKILYIILTIIIIILCVYVFIYIKNDNIKNVKRILKPEYSSITCLDNNCSFISASKKRTTTIFNNKGKEVGKFNGDKQIVFASENYYVLQNNNKYFLYNNSNKQLYKTKNVLIKVNDKYILEKGDKYSLIASDGNKIYNDISEYNLYNNDEIIEIITENKYIIYSEKKGKILNNYKIDKEVVKDDKTLYLIVKNIKNNYFKCYNVETNKIIGDSFENYTVDSNNELTIIKSENGKKYTYKLSLDGKEEKIDGVFSKVKEVNRINKKLNNDKYYLYSSSVYKENQEIVIVDNKVSKEIGFYNLKTNIFSKIYSYLNKDNIYSSLSKLNSDNDNSYLEISCNKSNCGENRLYVVNVNDSKIEFSTNKDDITLQNFTEYKNGYKVIKYSNRTNDEKYKDKYVLFDDKNNELYISDNQIIVLNEKILFGPVEKENVMLYSIKDKKILNSESASSIKINNKEYYKYNDSNKTIVITNKGKKIIEEKSIKYSEDSIISIDNRTVKMFDESFKYKKYELTKNETLDGENNNNLPYKGAIFINNFKRNYFKIVNFNGKIVKKIDGQNIVNLYQNENKKLYIITKMKKKNKTTFGLYLAK